jgi:hypothetical protein
MSTLYAKVLRDTDVEANFIGNKLEIRQFGFASDTKALVVRDEHGEYHFIRQYNDETVRGIIDALAGNLAAHVQNLEIHISDEERQTWNGKQDALVAGENIQIGTDGKTISATDTVYDDTDLQNRIEEEAATRGEADAELQAQIDTLLGAIIFIGRINMPNSAITQSALTAKAQELGRYPLVKGYCLIDNDSDDWVWDGESEWIDVGYYQVAQATNNSLGVVKGSSENLKIGVDGSGEMSVNGLQEALANSGSGIQPRVRLDRTDDWNTHTMSGFYLKQASANASDVANSPPYYTAGTGDWTLFVIGGTDGGATGSNAPAAPGGCIQLARYASNSTVILYYRSYGVVGSSNSAGWSAWTSLSFWGGFNSGTSTALQDPNQTLTAGQYSNNWTGANTPTGSAIRGSLLVLASDVEQIASNRQQVFFEQGGTNRAWYRTTANGTWKEIGTAVGDVSWNDLLDKPAIPTGANLTGQSAVFGQSAASGSAETWARSDHYHALPSAPTVPTGANLSSQAAAFGQSAQNGSAATWARSDHYHALPASPTVPTGADLSSQAAAFGQSARNGTSTSFARADHYHALPAAPTLSSLGGEASISAGTTDQFWRGDKSWQGFKSIVPVYGTSSNSASTTAKTSTITGFVRRTGSIVGISFTNANTASAPTLNVNSTGAANIQYNGSAPASGMLAATTVHIFQFDGTSWQLLNPVVTSGGSSIPTPNNSNLILRSIAVSSVIGYNWDKLNLDLDVKNTLPIANGGTGNSTAAGALANLGGIGDRITTYATSSTNFDNITTSGVYSVYGSSSSSNHSPSTSITGSNAWNLLVIGGNNGVIQIASPAGTSGGTVYYRVGGGSSSTSFTTTWQTLNSGGSGGGIPEPSDSLTYGRYNGGWRRAVNLVGDTMTGILNIERSASSPSDTNSYLRIRTNSGSIDGMRMGAANSGVSTCGGWIQGFYANGTTGGININPLGGYTTIGGGLGVGTFNSPSGITLSGVMYVNNPNSQADSAMNTSAGSRLISYKGTYDTAIVQQYNGLFFMPSKVDEDSSLGITGTWRIYTSGSNLVFARYENGWTAKFTI